MAQIVVSHLTQIIYAGSKFVLKGKNPVILGGISFIPVGYRKGAKMKEGIKFGDEIYKSVKESQKLVLFYGYSVVGSLLIPTILVINGKNVNLRVKMVNAYEEMIDRVEFPQMWEITPEGIESKKEVNLSNEEINKIFRIFKKMIRKN